MRVNETDLIKRQVRMQTVNPRMEMMQPTSEMTSIANGDGVESSFTL